LNIDLSLTLSQKTNTGPKENKLENRKQAEEEDSEDLNTNQEEALQPQLVRVRVTLSL
jgi:hypothetical protein